MNVYSFLAEDVSPATFGRMNFQGAILTDVLSVSGFPHFLETHAVFVVTDRISTSNTLKIELGASVGDDRRSEPRMFDISPPTRTSLELDKTVVVLPLKVQLAGPSTLNVHLKLDGADHTRTWRVDAGPGPTRAIGAPTLSSQLNTSGSRTLDIPGIVRGATHELFIVDPYLFPSNLADIVAHVSPEVFVRVLVPQQNAGAFRSASPAISSMHPRIRCHVDSSRRQAGAFHDRFLVVNALEVYCFGSSIKDVNQGRVTRIAKLFRLDEITSFLEEFEFAWANAAPL